MEVSKTPYTTSPAVAIRGSFVFSDQTFAKNASGPVKHQSNARVCCAALIAANSGAPAAIGSVEGPATKSKKCAIPATKYAVATVFRYRNSRTGSRGAYPRRSYICLASAFPASTRHQIV
jgi:hypothetical protein